MLNFEFKSYDHIRYQDGRVVSGPHGGANRVITVNPDKQNRDGFLVTIYNADGLHPLWRDNVQMGTKTMRIISKTESLVRMQGYGFMMDDYAFDIYHHDGNILKCTLYLLERNVKIEYLSHENKNSVSTSVQKEEDIIGQDLSIFQDFLTNWHTSLPMSEKIQVAYKTDKLTNEGVVYQNSGYFNEAITYYKMALSVMPINDDALRNIEQCYRAVGDLENAILCGLKLKVLENYKN